MCLCVLVQVYNQVRDCNFHTASPISGAVLVVLLRSAAICCIATCGGCDFFRHFTRSKVSLMNSGENMDNSLDTPIARSPVKSKSRGDEAHEAEPPFSKEQISWVGDAVGAAFNAYGNHCASRFSLLEAENTKRITEISEVNKKVN